MTENVEEVLLAFFQEVNDQLHIELKYDPADLKYPIHLADPSQGVSKDKFNELIGFIKSQGVDLHDLKIGITKPIEKSKKFNVKISMEAAIALAEVYALISYQPKNNGL